MCGRIRIAIFFRLSYPRERADAYFKRRGGAVDLILRRFARKAEADRRVSFALRQAKGEQRAADVSRMR